MFATRARLWASIAAGLAGLAALAAVGLWPATRRPAPPAPPAPQRFATLHVKMDREGFELALAGSRTTPLFSHLPPGTHDDRARWFKIEVPIEDVDLQLLSLRSIPWFEEVFLAPETTLATLSPLATLAPQPRLRPADDDDSCPIATPSFESYQGYLGPAPHGIDAPAAWRRGARGQGVWFADIEGNWNPAHEDLPGDRIRHAGGDLIADPSWRAHGTAVLGEVVGRDNARGVVGIAPDVERVFTSSIGGVSVADAIDAAAEQLRAGDVLLIELQSSGPVGRYIPVEYWRDVYDAIRAATDRGVVVIEAAGNGAEDLDRPIYGRAFDRTYRDSGAIMVGAGGPPRDGYVDRERLDFSNYGGRVDVQGWGRKVATLDYGDLQACAGNDRHYTGEFAGTSSASPIVAGTAVLLEGVARTGGRVIAPRDLRELLRRTGTPQTGDTSQQIGPRPDLVRALRELDARARD